MTFRILGHACRCTVTAFFLGVLTVPSFAALELPSIFSDHAIMQRDRPLPVWGLAKPGGTIKVEFAGHSAECHADNLGRWKVVLPPAPLGGPHRMSVRTDEEEKVLEDILLGDVWIAGGQSNMEWSISNLPDAAEYEKEAPEPFIRYFTGPNDQNTWPQFSRNGEWVVCSPQTVRRFSAVGYWFARFVRARIDVPIGLVDMNWGGTLIEPWTPPGSFGSEIALEPIAQETVSWHPDYPQGLETQKRQLQETGKWVDESLQRIESGLNPRNRPMHKVEMLREKGPSRIWNAMVYPFVPYAIRGAVWYQGESNEGDALYLPKLRALIRGWRDAWGQGEFPFYLVQLAAFQKEGSMFNGDKWTVVRDAQEGALQMPRTGMAVTIDIGDAKNIHPVNKRDVGERLSRWALFDEYGFKDVKPSGPLFASASGEADAVRVKFHAAEDGLMAGIKKGYDPVTPDAEGKLQWFAVCGADGKWFAADAVIEGGDVVVRSPSVPEPVEVSYAWNANPAGANLYNKSGLPASPFRAKVSQSRPAPAALSASKGEGVKN